ncbi:hypothetical protein BUALT_Bualt18G0096600 [Buddleja alternifolia]|uniref:DUF4283 domain-containing protein n=1 Tax=Buddleja alternifolia TaxID=168488 RepID=A0AAV6W9I1_9LAMI|nr:hypothetical protein BUALT_Bualt18G0096600 [Buddleja alternifolia]
MDPSLTADHQVPAAVKTTIKTNGPNTLTFAEKLKGNPRPLELAARTAKKTFVHGVDSKVIGTSVVINGRKTIFLSKEEDDFMAAPYQYSLVGKFSHGYSTMTRLRAKFAALGLNNGFKIVVLDTKHVWIRLFDPNDYARVWMKQTWYFDGFPMRVLKWTLEFDQTEESPIMPIWIKVFGLRPHWFHRQFLYHVASLIGKPLKLDEATTEIDNPVVARMCVEINVLDKLQPDVPIQIGGETRYFKIQYEGIPEYCRICRHKGHTMNACYVNKDTQEGEDQMNFVDEKEAPDVNDKGDLRAKLDKKRGKKPMVEMVEGSTLLSSVGSAPPVRILARNHNAGNKQDSETENMENVLEKENMIQDYSEKGEKGNKKNPGIDGLNIAHHECQKPNNCSQDYQENTSFVQEIPRNNQNRKKGIQESEERGLLPRDPTKIIQETRKGNNGNHGSGLLVHKKSSHFMESNKKLANDLRCDDENENLRWDMEQRSSDEEGHENLQLVILGHDVYVPDNDGTGAESGGLETSDETWHEVTSKKHRRAASLDGSSEQNANGKQLK